MRRSELLSSEEGIKLMISNWGEYIKTANKALAHVTSYNNELENYFAKKEPLSRNAIARMGGLRRVNNMMGIYTNDLHKHIRSLDSGFTPNYPPSYIPELRTIDTDAQAWRKQYQEAVKLYKELSECYQLSLYKSDGSFDFASWL